MPPQTPQQLDQDVVRLAKSIRKIESGDNFQARGKSGEYGAYQYTPETWAGRSRKYLGRDVPLEAATPEEQNEVQYKWTKEQKDKGYNVGQIASMHNAGEGRPNAYQEGFKGTNKYGVQYDVPAYAEKVARAYQELKAQQGNAPQGAPQGNMGYAPPKPPEPMQVEGPTEEKKGIGQNIAEFLFPILEKKERTALQTVGDVGMSALTLVPGAGLLGLGAKGAKIASLAGRAGKAAELASGAEKAGGIGGLLGKSNIAQGVGLGYGADVATKLGDGETDVGSVLTPGLGTAVGLGGGLAAGALGKVAPTVLSRTSGVPQKAFDVAADNPNAVQAALKGGVTAEKTRDTAVTAVKTLRKNMSSEWESGVNNLINKYEGRRVGLPESIGKELQDIANDYNTATNVSVRIPQNIQNLSVKELTDLITDINGLPYKALDPDRRISGMKDYLRNIGKKSFDEGGEFSGLYSQYAKRSDILREADSIVNAYKAKTPISRTTAINRLQKIFDEDKEEYLKAIQALEKETGVDILSQVAAGKFTPRMPRDLSKGVDFNDLIQILLLPLTSPRGALWLSKFMGTQGGPVSSGVKGLMKLAPVGAAQAAPGLTSQEETQ